MENTLDKQRNRNASIDIFRYICAVMVVAIHTHPFEDVNSTLSFIFTTTIPRIAVPFFLCTSGYFYVQKLISGKKVFLPYIKKLITVYLSWSAIYITIAFFRNVIFRNVSIVSFIKDTLYSLIITGSEYHFWFFPALIISVCIVTLFYKLKIFKALLPISIILYAIGCLGCAYYKIGAKIPLLSNLYHFSEFTTVRRIFLMALPFFMCGYLVSLIEKKFTFNNKSLAATIAICICLFYLEIILVNYFKIQREIVLTPFIYVLLIFIMMILLNNPLPQFINVSQKSKLIADFTYYFHPLFIIFLKYLSWKFLDTSIPATILFILTVGGTLGLGFLCTKLKKDNILRKIFF